MRSRRLEAVLWLVAIAAFASGAWRWHHGSVHTAASEIQLPAADENPVRIERAALLRAAVATTRRNPFRLDRRSSAVPYSADPPATLTEVAAVRAIPLLMGIVGPPYQAILGGIPGRDGSIVVRQGDTLATLRVRRLSRDTLVLAAPDTVWILTVRRAWQ